MDKRKNNKGTKGNKGGRPPKAEEQKLIEKLSPMEEDALRVLHQAVKSGEKWAVDLYMKYYYGLPKQVIDQTIKSEDIQITLEGGSRSGKTTDACQFIVWYCLHNTGKVITVGRDQLTALRQTLLIDFKQVLKWWGRTEKVIGVNPYIEINGNLIRFIGTNDDLMKTHGLTQDVFWLNEAMNISKDTIDQLEQRTSEFFIIDYNPSAKKHHIYSMEKRPDVVICKSTVLDNSFVPTKARNKILSYEPTKDNIELGTADEYKWQVYGLGKRTSLEGLIFTTFNTFEETPKDYDLKIYGLDFGYSNDPSACVEVIISGSNLYITELLYEVGLTNRDLLRVLDKEINRDNYVVCDSAEPKSITELRMGDEDKGIVGLSALGAKKGGGSINWGINKIKSYKVHLNSKSLNLIDEFESYKWKTDRTNELLAVPEDKNNHLIDAIRYALSLYKL
jgi:phage terminase large subunit